MEISPFLLATTISITFAVFKFIEMQFITKEKKPLKFLIRDSLLIYVSSLCGFYMLSNFMSIPKKTKKAEVFISDPDF